MKLSKAIRIATIAGSAALLAPAAHAVGPTFDGWTVTGGTVDVTALCASDSCSVVVSGDGFIQVEHVLGDVTYLQTIITEMGVTGSEAGSAGVAYSDESFILLGGNQKGIKSKQSMNDVASNFSGFTKLNLGWAASAVAGAANVEVSQSFSDPGTAVAGDSFKSSFNLALDIDSSGVTQGRSLSIDQTAELGDGVTPNTNSIQRYVAEQRQGTLQPMAAGSVVTLGGVDVKVVAAGDSVMMTWLGQSIQIDPDVATSIDTFGFQSFTNATTRDLNSDADTGNDRYLADGTTIMPHIATVSSSETTSFTATGTPFLWNNDFAADYDGSGTIADSEAPVLPVVGSF